MNLQDANAVLAKCAAFDNRKPSQATATAWADALADMPLADALGFVSEHYATSREWIMPADLNRAWHQLRKARQQAVPVADRPLPPQDATVDEHLGFTRAVAHAIGRGATVEQARAHGYATIGRPVPPPEITEHHQVPTRIGRAA